MKIYLFDNIIDGHHKKYNDAVFGLATSQQEFDLINCYSNPTRKSKNRIYNEFLKLKQISKLVFKLKKNDVLHFLYVDNMILALFVFYRLKIINKKTTISGTLHWSTNNKFKKIMLRYMLKNNLNLVCHSGYILDQQKQIYNGKNNFLKEIRYPYFPYVSNEKESNELSKTIQEKLDKTDMIKILYFGGTRLDKGVDILLESLKYVDNPKVSFFIIGNEEKFDKSFIENCVKNLKSDINIHLSYVNETTASYIFSKIDYTVLPYRRFFSGESGPLIDSLANKVKVIAPDTPVFKKNNEGIKDVIFYSSENPIDLGRTLNNLEHYTKNDSEKEYYYQRLDLNTFKKNYQEYFKLFLGEKL
ncbi:MULTISPECIES: glycosyltransferase [unclassified Exiguobacterium]|uniref:glycosyltransferase n=1 Tax=unclassified Exiguobacterium TaxID=2644629 RepID=UPI0025BEAC52|nr:MULTISPECIES: glycosyltransferase [unclassified Exiguobacterium]